MILWGRASSVNVQKVLWALDEFDLPFEHHIVGGRYGGLDDPMFRRLTPLGKVPVIEDGGIAVWESNAILRYLARRDPTHPLSRNMDHADPWMEFGTGVLQPPFIGLFWQLVRMRPEDRTEAAITSHKAHLAEAFDVMDRGFADGRAWLAGPDMSLADIAVGTVFFRVQAAAPEMLKGRSRIAQWISALAARPGWQAHVATSFDELRPSQ